MREAIVASAERLLAERRLDELSVEDVLQDAGVSRASFYFYFGSKHAIVAALLEDIVDDVFDASLPWFDRGDTPPEEALQTAIAGSLALWRRHALVLVATVDHWQSVPELREVWGAVMARFTAAAAAQIERDREAGVARSGSDVQRLAGVLVAMNERCFYYAVSATDPADDDQLVETMTGVWAAAVYGS